MPTFRKKAVEIDAEILQEDTTIETINGNVRGFKGELLITGVQGKKYPCDPKIFLLTYEPVDDESKKCWSKIVENVGGFRQVSKEFCP